ncbi:hypothetical protein CROQUDRAFT_91644 [Cronartium quercuum f. sp. fusiforme G11]|uniref:Uncharacterized protein n=1 Tax=Cronartium quercuum f. sp. fusiforme G11 TaxID=708437 RepID=A0A9P6TCW4_9BASI|nr:hypothetical protein CROQUDRAFT_91644 [Cronartium quercuum f. sp. fusiforme G11]
MSRLRHSRDVIEPALLLTRHQTRHNPSSNAFERRSTRTSRIAADQELRIDNTNPNQGGTNESEESGIGLVISGYTLFVRLARVACMQATTPAGLKKSSLNLHTIPGIVTYESASGLLRFRLQLFKASSHLFSLPSHVSAVQLASLGNSNLHQHCMRCLGHQAAWETQAPSSIEPDEDPK